MKPDGCKYGSAAAMRRSSWMRVAALNQEGLAGLETRDSIHKTDGGAAVEAQQTLVE